MASKKTNWGNYNDYSGPAKEQGSSIHVSDPRLDLLATLLPGSFTAKNCLDIGCNAGGVSCQVAFDYHAATVTGVDIDPNLVKQANKLLALRASRARPPTKESQLAVDYFPISAVLTHGYRIEPERQFARGSTSAAAPSLCPRVRFFSADWVTTSNQDPAGPYDIILALSVIKWIHLEHQDDGLKTFFRRCSSSLKPGGYLVIELQTWDSYEKAIRPGAAPHFAKNMKSLVYRPESFEGLLADEGLTLCARSDALPRRISVYRKESTALVPDRDLADRH